MGILSKATEEQGLKAINSVLNEIKPQDGKVHVLYVNLNMKIINGGLTIDAPNTNVLDALISELQDHREIVDISFSVTGENISLTRSVQILYK